jgi:hypothetical protein
VQTRQYDQNNEGWGKTAQAASAMKSPTEQAAQELLDLALSTWDQNLYPDVLVKFQEPVTAEMEARGQETQVAMLPPEDTPSRKAQRRVLNEQPTACHEFERSSFRDTIKKANEDDPSMRGQVIALRDLQGVANQQWVELGAQGRRDWANAHGCYSDPRDDRDPAREAQELRQHTREKGSAQRGVRRIDIPAPELTAMGRT